MGFSYVLDAEASVTMSMESGSADSAYPVANGVDHVPARTFRSTNKTSVVTRLDLSASTSIDTVAVINHNLRGDGSGNEIAVDYHASSTSFPATDFGVITVPTYAQHHAVAYIQLSSTVSGRYFWLNFSDTAQADLSNAADTYDSNGDGTDDAYYEFGHFLVGAKTTLSVTSNPEVGSLPYEILAEESVSKDGTRWAVERGVAHGAIQLSWQGVSVSELNELREMYRSMHAGANPGLIILDDDSDLANMKVAYYGRFVGQMRVSGAGLYLVQMTFLPEGFGEVV